MKQECIYLRVTRDKILVAYVGRDLANPEVVVGFGY